MNNHNDTQTSIAQEHTKYNMPKFHKHTRVIEKASTNGCIDTWTHYGRISRKPDRHTYH